MQACEFIIAKVLAKEILPCKAADIGITIRPSDPSDAKCVSDASEMVAAIDEYLSEFANPAFIAGKDAVVQQEDCIGCGSRLAGLIGSFTWGIVHGEGACSKCGYPGRAMHYIEDKDGQIFDQPLPFVLQYRPDLVAKAIEANHPAS